MTKISEHLTFGNINIHVNIDSDVDAKKLKSLLD